MPSFVEIGLVLLDKTLFSLKLAIWTNFSPLTQGCFLSSLVEIVSVVPEEILKIHQCAFGSDEL